SNRKSAKRFPIHPLGELLTDSSVESFARVGQIRHTGLGQDDADHSPTFEPPQDVCFARGSGQGLDGRLPNRKRIRPQHIVRVHEHKNEWLVGAIRPLTLPVQDSPEELFVEDVPTAPSLRLITCPCSRLLRLVPCNHRSKERILCIIVLTGCVERTTLRPRPVETISL